MKEHNLFYTCFIKKLNFGMLFWFILFFSPYLKAQDNYEIQVYSSPTMGKSFAGLDADKGLIFSPNLKGSYDFTKVLTLGFEYYGSTGLLFNPDSFQQQEHALYLATDLYFSPDWEFNAGFGYGLTNSTDRAIFKIILGRRF